MRKSMRHRLFASCNCCTEPRFSAQPFSASGISRRDLLAGGAALGVTAAAGGLAMPAFAQAKPHRIDIHHHVVPPSWLAAMNLIGRSNPPLIHWSVQKTLEDMDKGGVATSIVSPTAPQVTPLGKEAAVKIAREANEFGKKLMADHPGRFGVFATLPLPYLDESLKEIAYVFDTLKVDGIGMMTNYGDKWLGYDYFDPIWEELNRRKATVYTHPTDANCCVNLVQGQGGSGIEWGTDTTRTLVNLIFSGKTQKYRDINFIWSHGGGALVAFAERFLIQWVNTPPYKGQFTREQVQAELNRFYYDTAQVSLAGTLSALAKLVPVSQIVYGTDFPYRTAADHTKGVNATFSGDDLMKVDRDNALRLIPRLKAT
jgi:predicted TIM-barrel fold metal-dependent hydrolase